MFLVKFEFVIFESTFVKIAPATGALLPTNEELFMDTTKSLTLAWEKSTAPPSAVATLFSNTESVIVTNPLLK